MIVPKASTRRLLQEAAEQYHADLRNDDEALSYLIDQRKISKKALAYFRIGIVRKPYSGHEYMTNRLAFPYYTLNGVSSIRFRYLGDNRPSGASKFLSTTGDVARVYNVAALIGASKIFVCEGETDTIAAWSAGLPAIGFPGVMSWEPTFARILRHREVVVLADNDDDGQGKKFSDEIFTSLNGSETVMMPRGYDVSKFVAEYGVDALREKVGV